MFKSHKNSDSSVSMTIRIPGNWSNMHELSERLPPEVSIGEKGLIMADGTLIDASILPSDWQILQMFDLGCRQQLTTEERQVVECHKGILVLNGSTGSLESAYIMMVASAFIIEAGGAGVFIDNCAISHGGQGWLELVDEASPESVSFAFVSVVGTKSGTMTVGMQVLGFPDFELVMNEASGGEDRIVSLIRSICIGDKSIGVGCNIVDESGDEYCALETSRMELTSDHPMFNPFGYLKLIRTKDIVENN